MYTSLLIVSLVAAALCASDPQIRARAILDNGATGVGGMLNLTQLPHGVRVQGHVSGLSSGRHGFHIHQWGDIHTKGCDSTGGHFNPAGVPHGAQDDFERHVGDLGNIVADEQGLAIIDFTDHVIALFGSDSVVGRAFVVHAGEDDLGRGGNEGSAKTGNAGGRVACGIIALVP